MPMASLQLSVRLSLLLAAVCVVFLTIGGSAEADQPTAPIEYVVESGDTIWEIASAVASPDQDVRHLVADISRLSGVETGSIFPGQILLIPAG